jgi:hypothetical protein
MVVDVLERGPIAFPRKMLFETDVARFKDEIPMTTFDVFADAS